MMKVSDYRKMIRRVDTNGNVILDHLHAIHRGERQYWNYITMQDANETAVYRFLSGFDTVGWIDDGVFYAQVNEDLECDGTCSEAMVRWKYNWTTKTDDMMVKDGHMEIGLRGEAEDYRKDVRVSIERVGDDDYHVEYLFDGEVVRENYMKSSSQRYVMGKVMDNSVEVFEEHFWTDWKKRYR